MRYIYAGVQTLAGSRFLRVKALVPHSGEAEDRYEAEEVTRKGFWRIPAEEPDSPEFYPPHVIAYVVLKREEK